MSLETNLQNIIGQLVLQLATAQTANQDLTEQLAKAAAPSGETKTPLTLVPKQP